MPEGKRGPAATCPGSTAAHVAANVRRLREQQGLSTYQLARAMQAASRPIPQSGVSRIEAGHRRVDVDDLVAFAVVFGVSPAALLLPLNDASTNVVDITGAGTVPADIAWAWASNERPLAMGDADPRVVIAEYRLRSLPPGQWHRAALPEPTSGAAPHESTGETP
ncbi:helix-turn-helix domain-containing protein [Streptomyces sp. C10-9-1]|uniref:helix-turn-helix domain-containing protein n=1 Tax=Streptomyces sp. C10-9-1 TaxID=1859285 RepID=UPI003F4A70C7